MKVFIGPFRALIASLCLDIQSKFYFKNISKIPLFLPRWRGSFPCRREMLKTAVGDKRICKPAPRKHGLFLHHCSGGSCASGSSPPLLLLVSVRVPGTLSLQLSLQKTMMAKPVQTRPGKTTNAPRRCVTRRSCVASFMLCLPVILFFRLPGKVDHFVMKW